MAKGLTEKQRKILEFIIDFQQNNGFPPTIRELGDAFQIGSLRGVTVHLDALVRKGYMTRERTSRSIRVIGPDPRDPGNARRSDATIRLPLVRSLASMHGREIVPDKIAADGQVEGYVTVPEEVAGSGLEGGFVIRVGATGIKNEPVLPGDLLVVRPQRSAHIGELVVTFSHGDMTVLRATEQDIQESGIGGEHEIIGRVVALVRRY
ncbi:MAG: hypothetical protein SFU56_00890 [Capsulimonadales bacterium]|nr:hypothetical protein [Capsulimonadales bacterium]